MSPHFVYWECRKCEKAFVDRNCFANGKYCSFDVSDKFSGQQIILENLRQKCIHKIAYDGGLRRRRDFWGYVAGVHSECGSTVTEECS